VGTSSEPVAGVNHVLLDLLAQEASLEAFERERRAARGDAEALELVNAALRVRSTLADLRRREQELTALNETAQDLAGLRDVEPVLRAIVRRARELLGSELAYITLIDEATATTYMRTVEGNISEAFAHLRLPLGAGLGGVVAERGTPVATDDCRCDPRIKHPEVLARAVSDEGLVAVVGVPLRRGARVIGVLYAADRHPRSFPSHDVALLSSLAAHAAIAIDNARMYRESELTLTALAEAGAAARQRGAALERVAAARERLLRAVLDGDTLDGLAALLAELIAADVVVVDLAGRVLAGAVGPRTEAMTRALAAGSVLAGDPHRREVREALAQAMRSGRSQRLVADGEVTRWIVPAASGPDAPGAVVAGREPALDDPERSILENAALIVGVRLASERAVVAAEERVRAELLTDVLLAPDRHPVHLRRRAELLGIDLDAPHAVAVACGDVAAGRAAMRELTRRTGGVAGEHLGRAVALIATDTLDAAAELLDQGLRRALGAGFVAGITGPVTGTTALAAAFEEAERLLRCAGALGRTGVIRSEALGAFGLLLAPHARADVDRFVAVKLGPLLRWDAERGSDLAGTLARFFECGTNVTRTAAALHVHVNTLYQRLDRIKALLGEDPQDTDVALDLHMALRLHALRASG
jgi:GAF domain-containing protein